MSESLELTANDLHLFNQGRWHKIYRKMGAHLSDDPKGCYFRVWAPNAEKVSVIGQFNEWQGDFLTPQGTSGIWSGFVPEAKKFDLYKFKIQSKSNNFEAEKSDPFAFLCEVPDKTASKIWKSDYRWKDQEWLSARKTVQGHDQPMAVYEVHLGSWRRNKDNEFLTYRELADLLPQYIKEMGYTHVEMLPIMEHPFYGSWGYQVTGYYAPSSRFGTPDDLKYLIDRLHQENIGVILDWVPSHFPNDEFALAKFDGTHLYEHQDIRKGYHPDWKSLIFNYGRNEVRAFLIGNALYWFDEFHIDGLRVDAVASILYLDYSRRPGEWIPNEYGGRENLEGIRFIQELNETIYNYYPDVQTIAEESTAWPMVSKPIYVGGLGFGMKWDMGWMHDTLSYFARDPIYRSHHQDQLSFRMMYAFNERFMLPLSHDEVVYGKGSLPCKMPADDWQKFANARCLLAYMYAQPGKKLMFMGLDFGQWEEWNHDRALSWESLNFQPHQGLNQLVKDLNFIYKRRPSLFELDFDAHGFHWIDASDFANSVYSFVRKDQNNNEQTLVVMNLTPEVHYNYSIGVPNNGVWNEILNTDAKTYFGSGVGNQGSLETVSHVSHGFDNSLNLTLPPLAVLYFDYQRGHE